eukprot:TRINITY_DN748_c0_g1_i1.p1 TRINITY_DN748_c0_g1~~TRINITY_DN748_c0_g1_i1.p1  ORF type:complete len:203 (+),score=72.70 TRINITY_DN748_c0_g1_i1:65-673(+)
MSDSPKPVIRVAVASTSKQKVPVVAELFTEHFADATVETAGQETRSGVGEQPFGNEETLQGATNRLNHLKSLCVDNPPTYYVAIENGLSKVTVSVPAQNGEEKSSSRDFWMDLGWVLIEEAATGRQSVAVSPGLQFPEAACLEAQRRGFDRAHAGMVLHEKTGCDKADPHSVLTGGAMPRKTALKLALKTALSQLCQPELQL